MRRYLLPSLTFLLILACGLPSEPPPLNIETLRAQVTTTPRTDSTFTPPPINTNLPPSTAIPAGGGPGGKIVFTCQVPGNQICIMNADGSGFRQLTSDPIRHWYASLSPDGASVIYSAYAKDNVFELYEIDLASGKTSQLTNDLGVLIAPEVSPDGKSVVFTWGDAQGASQIWLMDRNGGNPHRIHKQGWDPTWSPDGKQILFASNMEGANQLFVMDADGSNVRQVTHFEALRGRSDWSPDGQWMVTYNGPAWNREVYIFHPDFSELRQLTPTGGNSQGPAFSPDGDWVTFTAYFDHYGDDLGCEIYIIRVDGTDLRRLTDNAYCDYQPRWGP
jgi:TolB protein